MNEQKLRNSVTAMILATLMVAPAGFSATKKRAARTGSSAEASLSGKITDEAAGTGISGALVSTQGQSQVTTADGTYRLPVLRGGTSTVTIERFGFFTQTRSVELVAGSNTLNVSLSASPRVTVTTVGNQTILLVADTVMFSSNPGGLLSPRDSPAVTVCGSSSAAPVTYDRSEISIITGPAVASTGCCAIGQQVGFVLKNSQKFDATFAESCVGYTLDLMGRNVVDGKSMYLSFKNILRVQFP